MFVCGFDENWPKLVEVAYNWTELIPPFDRVLGVIRLKWDIETRFSNPFSSVFDENEDLEEILSVLSHGGPMENSSEGQPITKMSWIPSKTQSIVKKVDDDTKPNQTNEPFKQWLLLS